MLLLKLNNIRKSFNGNIVLENINLEVKKGDCIYIHGKNGCGKSTLFKIICDILKADEGTISKSNNTHIGALIENPGFIESESIKFNLKFLGSLKNNYDEQNINKLCNDYFLDFNNRSALKSYSVGMRQKVGIIQVHWINKINIRVLLRQMLDSMTYIQKSLAKVLTAMTSNKHHATIAIQAQHIISNLADAISNFSR